MELGKARNETSVEETPQREQPNASIQRLHILSSHLTPVAKAGESYLVRESCSRAVVRRPVSTVVLAHYMAGEHRAEKEKVLQFFQQHPDLLTPVEIPKEQHRELVLRQLLALVREAGVHPLQALTQDPSKYFTIAEAVGLIDLSLAIKMGVQNSLWGGSVINLGTQKHHEKFFAGIDNLDYPGCFAMTELHHGSNVQGIQTTATFDPARDEFIVNTPNEGATKWWIGNAACHGKFATVFARLWLPVQSSPDLSSKAPRNFEDFGVHAIIVPLRSLETGAVLPGVEIRDCGYKVGLNGVDNGAIRFYNVRVPRENLLDRFGSVAADGQYSSDLPSASKRFAATLGELVGGRVGLAYGSVGVLKIVTTIAVRYSLLRQQFGPSNKPEVAILDYQSQQQRLMPMLASAYAFHFAAAHLVKQYSSMKAASRAQSQGTEELVADVHVLSAGLKAYVTAYTQAAISTCRESCGGHGYAAVNRFGQLRNDHDIFLTFEGDNTVLLQQVAADLLKRYKEKFAGGALSVAWTYLKDSMGTYLAQTNPVTTHREGQAHLRDPQFQLDAFQYRTAKLLHTAALRLRKHTPRLGPFGAWNRCLNHLLTLAESHIESVILAHFIAAVDRCEDKESKQALKLLCDLYALDRIWSDIGTYRNEDYVAPNKAKAIHRLVEYLCYEARGMARELVDAFGIPDALLRAPIGLQSGQYAEYSAYIGF